MDYASIKWKTIYTSTEDNLLEDFYKPAIEFAISYKRLAGYFSATFLEVLSKEIKSSSYHNNNKISIVCSPQLSEEDLQNIKLGYDIKNTFEKNVHEVIQSFSSEKADETLPIISELIALGILNVKFAIPKNDQGMFHAKTGVFTDANQNKIGFSGSNNETYYAVNLNYESFVVLNSWENERYTKDLENKFDDIWDGLNTSLLIKDVTDIIKTEVKKRIFDDVDSKVNLQKISIKSKYNLRDYQLTAIQKWKNNNFQGIFEMATGTGKTVTALGAIGELSDNLEKLATVIVVPQKDLVLQWQKDIVASGSEVLLCYSDNPKWPDWLISRLNGLKFRDQGFLTLIVTNDTFASTKFQNIVSRYSEINFLLVSDEVHSFGSEQIRKLFPKLNSLFQYRLGLSATPFRRDKSETKKLIHFFNETVYSYSLKEAINNGVLNTYNYHPTIMYYEEELLEQYRYVYYKNRVDFLNNNINAINELDTITTSIANASKAKIQKVFDNISKRDDDFRIIVYCAPGKYNDFLAEHDEKHIEFVAKLLGGIEGLKLRIIRSQVPTYERKEILDYFIAGKLNALVAIKCLDQGIDLPNVNDAYIMSSVDSETEFIQRRGRILRTYQGKPTSNIYDYILLPRNIDDPNFSPDESDAYLVHRELKRMKSYMNGSSNEYSTQLLIDKITNAYYDILEDYYEQTRQ